MILKKQTILKQTVCFFTGAALLFSSFGSFAANKSSKMTEEQYLREQAIRKSQMYQSFARQDANNATNPTQAVASVSYQPQAQQLAATALNGEETNPIQAQQNQSGNRVVNCWDEASKVYGVDPWLIFAYAKTESAFKPWATNDNKTSIDRGLMQINSTWLPTLAKYNIKTEHLFDSCVSIFVGTWIIRQNINRYGYNYHGLVAYNVGNPYNPKTEAVARNYYRKLNENYQALTAAYRR